MQKWDHNAWTEFFFFFFFFAVFLLNCRFFEQDSSMEQHATGQSHLYFGFLLLQYGPLGLGTFGPHDPACGIGATYILWQWTRLPSSLDCCLAIRQTLVIMSVLHRLKEPQFLVDIKRWFNILVAKMMPKCAGYDLCIQLRRRSRRRALRYNRNVVVMHSG